MYVKRNLIEKSAISNYRWRCTVHWRPRKEVASVRSNRSFRAPLVPVRPSLESTARTRQTRRWPRHARGRTMNLLERRPLVRRTCWSAGLSNARIPDTRRNVPRRTDCLWVIKKNRSNITSLCLFILNDFLYISVTEETLTFQGFVHVMIQKILDAIGVAVVTGPVEHRAFLIVLQSSRGRVGLNERC